MHNRVKLSREFTMEEGASIASHLDNRNELIVAMDGVGDEFGKAHERCDFEAMVVGKANELVVIAKISISDKTSDKLTVVNNYKLDVSWVVAVAATMLVIRSRTAYLANADVKDCFYHEKSNCLLDCGVPSHMSLEKKKFQADKKLKEGIDITIAIKECGRIVKTDDALQISEVSPLSVASFLRLVVR
ncbi:uncharacterized protein PHALS_11759 [Plasmopara halstedii]|uniref:Uncharacterized protein n=1 Tax=Plasmopara halstedii TaxID=4781 RepID=A0A0P1AKG3_PLAHL|nr:uncharacterized protein PHALS_11759 [Plasmopara halstedii]CEG41410.1 hypothetical protein PHALS_11759 [Plasmopara halstedii]|eukprot:XP_024577779.1 hypothetical protein PHALS_11759 [Plasmopara halstedii]